MPTNVTGRIELSDFRAGIFGDFHLGSAETPADSHDGAVPVANGAATIENTYRCSADRTGALVPLPRLSGAQDISGMVGTRTGDAASSPSGFEGAFLVDAVVADGLVGTSTAELGVFCLYRFFRNDRAYAMVRFHELHRDGTVREVHLTRNRDDVASPTRLTGANFAKTRGRDSDGSIAPTVTWAIPAHREPGVSTFVPLIRENNNPLNSQPNADEAAFSTYETDQVRVGDFDSARFPISDGGSLIGIYPDVTHAPSPSGDDFGETTNRDYRPNVPVAMPGPAVLVVGHQGRLLLARRPVNSYGGNEARVIYDEVSYSQLLRPELFDGSDVFGYENTSPIGLMASIGVDELLIVKQNGGGVTVRGDVRNPTVSILPFVEPTRGAVAQPAFGPLGLVYGTRTGVWVWAGGEVSEHLSPQIDGHFWKVGDLEVDGNRGRFAWWHPWVLAPNAFVYDTRHQSWWRLDEPGAESTPVAYDVAGVDNTLYAFEARVTETQTTAWRTARENRLATSYSWQSQPLMETRDRLFAVREVRLVATTSDDRPATVTVTLSGYDADGQQISSKPVVFDLAGAPGRPQMLNKQVETFTAAVMQVRIEASGGDPSGDTGAPKVHALNVGYTERQMIPRQDS